ncbi:universal stress protein [Pseudonocardia sp. GCM10023141]|uniref:universal stress protein n=1 Tax=Pseudonocardia sp. GCM10023141 TaxID=3252653 RepID=UPI003618F508
MGFGSSALARPTSDDPQHLERLGRVVLVDRPEAPNPGWVAAWCGDVGYELVRTPAVPDALLDGGPHGDAWPEVAMQLGALSAAGSSVLLRRTALHERHGMRVVAAINDLTDDETVLTEAVACATALGASLELVHGVPLSFGERSVGLDDAVGRGLALLQSGREYLAGLAGATATGISTRLLRVRPHELVNELLDADLLVVGGARTEPAGRLGLVALSAMQHAPCPVLLTPRRPR